MRTPLIPGDRHGYARHRQHGHLDSVGPDRPSLFLGLPGSLVDQVDMPSGDLDSGGLGMTWYLVLCNGCRRVCLVCRGYRLRVLPREYTRSDRLVVVGHVAGVDSGRLSCLLQSSWLNLSCLLYFLLLLVVHN